nr:MAG TPA: hypothetical protein [Caudoviricetes sp.]
MFNHLLILSGATVKPNLIFQRGLEGGAIFFFVPYFLLFNILPLVYLSILRKSGALSSIRFINICDARSLCACYPGTLILQNFQIAPI